MVNITKIVPPSDFVLSFYYYSSTVTLSLTWMVTPLLLYVILTQSKKLKSFKWFILNHLFWCMLFENLIGFIKPLILAPACSGFPLGLMRYTGGFEGTGIAAIVGVILANNCLIGLGISIVSRYMLVFPTKLTSWFSPKIAFGSTVTLTMIFNGCIIYAGIGTLSTDIETIYTKAKELILT